MVDLKELSPAALSAAMRGGTDQWGRWGSIEQHLMYVEPQTARGSHYLKCRCSCNGKAKYRVMANGVCMGEGCELSMRRRARERPTTTEQGK